MISPILALELYRGAELNLTKISQICVMEMEPFEIVGEISDYRSYQEYRQLTCAGDVEVPIFQKMQRRILFDEQGIYENKMVITKEASMLRRKKRKCVYTVVQDGETSENTMEHTFQKCIQYCREQHLTPTGEVYIGMLLLHGAQGKVRSYLEIRGYIE